MTMDVMPVVAIAEATLLGALAVIGLVVIAAGMRALNLAHGALLGLGAVLVVVCERLDLPVALAFVAAPLAGAVVGRFIERTAPAGGHDVATLLVSTWAVAVVLRVVIGLVLGDEVVPPVARSGPLPPAVRLVADPRYVPAVAVLALLVAALAAWTVWLSPRALRARAVRCDRALAERCGIDPAPVDRGILAAGTALAALAGAVLAPLLAVDAHFGLAGVLGELARGVLR